MLCPIQAKMNWISESCVFQLARYVTFLYVTSQFWVMKIWSPVSYCDQSYYIKQIWYNCSQLISIKFFHWQLAVPCLKSDCTLRHIFLYVTSHFYLPFIELLHITWSSKIYYDQVYPLSMVPWKNYPLLLIRFEEISIWSHRVGKKAFLHCTLRHTHQCKILQQASVPRCQSWFFLTFTINLRNWCVFSKMKISIGNLITV